MMTIHFAPKTRIDHKKPGELGNALAALPEIKPRQQLESTIVPIFIFDKNYSELRTMLEFIIHDPKSKPLTAPVNRDSLQFLQMDVLRLLHNYVAASLTFLDNVRIVYEKLYRDSDKLADYPTRIRAEFETDPLAQFVKGLRSYFLHFTALDIVVGEFLSRDPEGKLAPEKRVLLHTKDLNEFNGWSITAKEYLNKPVIDLLELADSYHTKVMDFHHWFISRQK